MYDNIENTVGRKFEVFISEKEATVLEEMFQLEHPGALCFSEDSRSIIFGGVKFADTKYHSEKIQECFEAIGHQHPKILLSELDGMVTMESFATAMQETRRFAVVVPVTESVMGVCGFLELTYNKDANRVKQMFRTSMYLIDDAFEGNSATEVFDYVREYVSSTGWMAWVKVTNGGESEGGGLTPEQTLLIAKIPTIETAAKNAATAADTAALNAQQARQMAKEATPVFTAVVKNVSVVNSTTQLAQEVVWNETTGRFVARLRGSGSLSYTYYATWTANDAVASSESYNVRDRVYRMGTELFAIVGGGLTKVGGSNLVIE